MTVVWEGTSISHCSSISSDGTERCAAMQNIALHDVPGARANDRMLHKCAYGNRVCRNMDEQGVIRDGAMNGRLLQMRVMLEDGSPMCFFTATPHDDGRPFKRVPQICRVDRVKSRS